MSPIMSRVREMFEYSEADGCRHQALVRHFEERIAGCEDACDHCRNEDILASVPRAKSSRSSGPPRVVPGQAGPEWELFEKLKARRRELADERGVPAYVIFSDATLLEMAAHRPKTEGQLLAISGVGPTKLERYGEAFLAILLTAEAS